MRYVKPDGTKYNKLSVSPYNDAPMIKTMFFAADTAKGGNSLMGGDHNGYPSVGLPHTPSTDFSTPIISAAGHNWGYTELSNEFNKATSIFRTNGVPVNANATPFSGGQDVFSVRLAGGKRGDVLAEYGYDDGVTVIGFTFLPWAAPNSSWDVTGVRMNLGWGAYRDTAAFDFGVFSASRSASGLFVNVFGNYTASGAAGWQTGLVNVVGDQMRGLQVGLVNYAERLSGVQIGLLNFARSQHFFPIINIAW